MGQTVFTKKSGISDYLEHYHKAAENRYQLFSSVWAIATLFHMANHRMFTQELHYFLLSAAAIFLLIKPSSLIRMLIFISLQLYEVYNALPMGSNHWIFAAFVNLTILQALLYQVIKRRSFRIDRPLLLETFAPVVRIELIILYFYVVFHKLNAGFFTTEVSCASNFYVAQNAYSILPSTDTILALNAYATVFIEALIPVLLCFRITRNWGLLLGLVFHCIIAYNPLNGFYDFSSLIFAIYFLFTSYSFSNKLYSTYKAVLDKRLLVKAQLPLFSFQKLLVICLVFLAGLALVHLLTTKFEDYFRHVLWTAFSFTFIAIFLAAMFSRVRHKPVLDRAFAVKNGYLLIIPLLVFLNGASPYLGLKTESSFAMFSNLRTEGGVTNHFLVPVESQIYDFQKELIEIESSSDKVLQEYADNNMLMVYAHFQRVVTLRRPKEVKYIRKAQPQTFVLANAGPDHELLQEQPYWLRKFIRFRTISKIEPQPCAH